MNAPTGYIAVGDIHGCPAQLEEILALGETYPGHQWVFLGDYIDRGPDSEAVVRRLLTLDAVFLLGNHEEMLISRGDQWREAAGLSEDSLKWIKTFPVEYYETDRYFFVHGGLDPAKPMDQQTRWDYLWTKRPEGDYSAVTSKIVVHGHHSVTEPVIQGNRININTCCGAGGPLTALVLPEGRFFQSSRSPVPKPGLTPGAPDTFLDELLEELPDESTK